MFMLRHWNMGLGFSISGVRGTEGRLADAEVGRSFVRYLKGFPPLFAY